MLVVVSGSTSAHVRGTSGAGSEGPGKGGCPPASQIRSGGERQRAQTPAKAYSAPAERCVVEQGRPALCFPVLLECIRPGHRGWRRASRRSTRRSRAGSPGIEGFARFVHGGDPGGTGAPRTLHARRSRAQDYRQIFPHGRMTPGSTPDIQTTAIWLSRRSWFQKPGVSHLADRRRSSEDSRLVPLSTPNRRARGRSPRGLGGGSGGANELRQ